MFMILLLFSSFDWNYNDSDFFFFQGHFPYHAFMSIHQNFRTMVPIMLWFCYSDGMVTPFGIVDVNNNKKESYFSYRNYTLQP